jgi:hypothetical protein
MDNLIAPTQTSYIKGRYIMNNIVCAIRLYILFIRKKIKSILFELVFKKVFYRVNWNFLLDILQGRNFGDKWLTRIKNILYNSTTSININVQLGEYCSCKCDVR